MQKTTHNPVMAWAVTLTAALFFLYEFIQLTMPNMINSELRQAFDLDAEQVGVLISMYFWANMLCLFPAGNLLDRYSTKKLLIFAALLCTIGTFIFSTAQVYFCAALGRFIVGMGAAFCFLSCIRLASRWFPPTRMALVTGIVVTMAMIGGLVGQSPMLLLVKAVGWREAIFLDGILGIVVILIVLWLVQDRPPNSQDSIEADKHHLQSLGFFSGIKLVLTNPNNWLGGTYTTLLNLPVFLLGSSWGGVYLEQIHHLTRVQSSYAADMLFVGVIFGSPAFGWFSDHIGRRCLPMMIGAVLSLIAMMVLMYAPDLSLTSLMFLFFLIGFVTSSQVLSYPAIAELNPIALTGTALSIASVLIMGSGVVALPLFGKLLELNWDHTKVGGAAIYSLHDFNTALWIIPIAFIIGLVISFLIRETYCESQV